ncbi:hypothetical protein BsWGS_17950 [Bradybaena similaris]
MTIYSTVSITGGIKVIVDDRLCAVPNFTNGTNMVKCISETAGRVLTVKAYLNVTICKVQIFTCTAGKRGPNCNALCVNGTYGLACRPCNCRGKESCRKTDGFCPSGCLGASYYKNYDCYYTSISRKDDGHFVILTEAYVKGITFIPSFSRNEIILRKASGYYGDEQNCTFFESRANSKVAVVEVSYQPSIVVRHVVITYCHIDISPPYSVRITVDGRSCFGKTVHSLLPLGTHTFTCQKTVAAGNTLIISFTSHNLNSNSTVVVGLSKIAVLACAKGFYGSSCKIPCHCLGSACDPVTGYCPSGLCAISARGRNCASLNIAFLRPVLGRASVGHLLHTERPDGKQLVRFRFPPAAYYRSEEKWMSWRMAQLDGVYHIQGITVRIKEDNVDKLRKLAVYTDTASYIESDIHGTQFWKGIGCTGDRIKQTGTVIDVQCVGPARIIIIVTYSYSPYFAAEITDIEVWECEDGTFGPMCEGICNCRNDEVCSKETGECSSGCAEGYWGLGCQSPCVPGIVEASCWQVCNCTKPSSGCGPGVILCETACAPGWMGVKCDIQCPEGWYGADCTEKCGPCKLGDHNDSCDRANGRCRDGCANNLTTPTCKTSTRDEKVSKEAAIAGETANAIKYITFGLGIALVAIAIIYLCVRLCLVTDVSRKQKSMQPKQNSSDVNEKIMREHRDFHENFVHKKALQQAVSPAKRPYTSFLQSLFHYGKSSVQQKGRDSVPKILFGIKKDYKGKVAGPDRCKPLDDNTQQNSDQKVALWILREDFSALINRRQDRLQQYKGDTLHIKESSYTISTVNLTRDEIDKLYDEVGALGIP